MMLSQLMTHHQCGSRGQLKILLVLKTISFIVLLGAGGGMYKVKDARMLKSQVLPKMGVEMKCGGFRQMFGANFDACHPTDIKHQFNAQESDWGFTSFMPLSELYDPARGYLVNDTIVVEADVAVCRVGDYLVNDTVIVRADVSVHCLQDSKKETGSVGLKNCKAEQDGHKESSQPPS
ncbi:hypothetical protein HYC85_025728 [Camellia sinensis]|uniref:MATH domain-containing protein n=1 Tax=Camellia sinensis TaxID=4442 RepID=A0A7J7GBY9_CAMSI|nr:hypothetical protein HYC85_025728 [Camellia sinensis]